MQNRSERLLICLLGLTSIIWAQAAPKPLSVPDEVAYMFLFEILKDAPPPHWDFETKCNWLAKHGVTPDEAQNLVNISNETTARTSAIEKKLSNHHEAFRGRLLDADALGAETALRAELVAAAANGANKVRNLNPSTVTKIQAKIAEIKREVKHSPDFKPSQHKH